MKIAALTRFFFCAFVATALTLSAHAQSQVGRIIAQKVEGQVLRIAADGSSSPVSNGQSLAESDTITTGKSSGVVLVFENGSSVKLGPDSRLAVEEFKVDPFADNIEVSKLTAEPSVSKTTLNLAYGEMVGDVKKLNKSAGSSYNIKTPVGAAGIRGTIYRIVFKPDANGKAFFQVQTAEGLVVFSSASEGAAGAQAATQEVQVPADKEISITLDIPDTGKAFVVPQLVSAELPAEQKEAIQTATQAIVEAAQQTVIPPAPPSTPANNTSNESNNSNNNNSNNNNSNNNNSNNNESNNQQSQQPIPIQVTTPPLTQGAGQPK